jgi:hypothetical protein
MNLLGPASGDLGDYICTEGDCQIGRDLVYQMQQFYQNVVTSGAGGSDFQSKYGPIVATLVQTLNDTDTFAVHWLPFHPGCCTIKNDIGKKAQDVLVAMGNTVGGYVPSPTDVSSPSGGLSGLVDTMTTLLKWGAVVGGAVAAIWIVTTGLSVAKDVKAIKPTPARP